MFSLHPCLSVYLSVHRRCWAELTWKAEAKCLLLRATLNMLGPWMEESKTGEERRGEERSGAEERRGAVVVF